MKRAVTAMVLSIVFHVILPVVGTIGERHGWWTEVIGSIVFYPAKLFSDLMPDGHGIPQLVLPFVFSIVFYAVVFWIFLTVYAKLHRNSAGIGSKTSNLP